MVLWAELSWHIWWPPSRIVCSSSLVLLWGDVLARLCIWIHPISKVGKVRLQQGLDSCVLTPSDYHGSVHFVTGHSQDGWGLEIGFEIVEPEGLYQSPQKRWNALKMFGLSNLAVGNMLWFAKLSCHFSHGSMVVVPIAGVCTYGIFCFKSCRVLEVGHFWASEPLVAIQCINCEIIYWYLRQSHCVL